VEQRATVSDFRHESQTALVVSFETLTGWQKSAENNGLLSAGCLVSSLTGYHAHNSLRLEQASLSLTVAQLSPVEEEVATAAVWIAAQWYLGPTSYNLHYGSLAQSVFLSAQAL
jgi:hypothetical protein